MKSKKVVFLLVISVFLARFTMSSAGQAPAPPESKAATPTAEMSARDFAVRAMVNYSVDANIIYSRSNNTDLKLDVYRPRHGKAPNPTVMMIHGGGWVEGFKEGDNLEVLPWLEEGWSVVNVEYRLARVSPAPAAVEDCRCALRWIFKNAAKFGFDIHKIVVTGGSAGGHLALMTGMLPAKAGFDAACPAGDNMRWERAEQFDPKVAAIVNFFGITDVKDMLAGPNARGYAIEWIGSPGDGSEAAKNNLASRVSPLTYVRAGPPPIITVHGDADTLVPYAQAQRLHRALDKAGVPNQLVTLHGAGHGGFSISQYDDVYRDIRNFLAANMK